MTTVARRPRAPDLRARGRDVRARRGRLARRRRRHALPRPRRPASPSSGSATCHPAPLAAAHEQLDRLWHVSNLYWTEPMAGARRAALGSLRRRAGVLLQLGRRGERGGAQVRAQGDRQAGVVALEGSFHGRTFGALVGHRASPRSGRPSSRSSRASRSSQPNDAAALAAAVGAGHRGDHPSSRCRARAASTRDAPAFLAGGRASWPTEHGALLCLRRGADRRRAHRHVLRLGAARREARRRRRSPRGSRTGCRSARCSSATTRRAGFVPGDHASTFGGNPVTCAAACAVVDELDR